MDAIYRLIAEQDIDTGTGVRFTPQTLDEAQQEQARQNIGVGSVVWKAENKTALAETATSKGMVYVNGRETDGDGYEGFFKWTTGDLSSQVASDPLGVFYVPPTGQTGSSGAWVRTERDIVTVEMCGAKGDNSTDDIAAFEYAISLGTRIVSLTKSRYYLGRKLVNTRAGVAIVGPGAFDVVLRFNPLDGGFVSTLPDPLVNTRLGSVELHNVVLDGGGNTTDSAVSVIKQERFRLRDVRWLGFYNGLDIAGGQMNSYSGFIAMSPGTGSMVSGSAAIRIRAAINTDGSYQQAYTNHFSDFMLTGGGAKGIEDIISISNADGAKFVNGYVALGNRSILKLDSLNGGIGSLSFLNVYFDGVFQSAAGTQYGIYIPQGSGSSFISATFGAGCYFGQYATNVFNIDCSKIFELNFDSVTFNRPVGALGVIDGKGAGHLSMVNCRASSASGTLEIKNFATVIARSNKFINITGTGVYPLTISGTIGQLQAGGNVYSGCTNNHPLYTATFTNKSPDDQWYEEKVAFTPTVTIGGSSTGITYSIQSGMYNRTGSTVKFNSRVQLSSKGGLTGDFRMVMNFPFMSVDLFSQPLSGPVVNNVNSATMDGRYLMAEMANNAGSAIIRRMVTGGTNSIVGGADLTDTSLITLGGEIIVA